MDCGPEISVVKRKVLSLPKTAKRLRRFVLDNQRPTSAPVEEDDAAYSGDTAHGVELVCRVPDETLFQLQQIYQALEAKTKDAKPTKSKRRSTAGERLRTAEKAATISSSIPERTPSKKRARGPDAPAIEMISRQGGVEGRVVETDRKSSKKKKKERRKSAAT